MTDIHTLLTHWQTQHVQVYLEQGTLRMKGPKAALAQCKPLARARREEILRHLQAIETGRPDTPVWRCMRCGNSAQYWWIWQDRDLIACSLCLERYPPQTAVEALWNDFYSPSRKKGGPP